LFEDFDLDKFLEDPESQFHDDSDPNIVEGDWVTSYRGPGKFLSLVSRDMAKVQLINGPQSVVTVPFEMLQKITKEEALKMSREMPDTKREISAMNKDMEAILKASVSEDDETGEEVFVGDLNKTISYIEDFLIDLIDLKNKDSYAPYYTEFSNFISGITTLCFQMLDYIQKRKEILGPGPELENLKREESRIEVIQDKFFDVSD
jgi:hypothetical protein